MDDDYYFQHWIWIDKVTASAIFGFWTFLTAGLMSFMGDNCFCCIGPELLLVFLRRKNLND
jgi:hypothetical protein